MDEMVDGGFLEAGKMPPPPPSSPPPLLPSSPAVFMFLTPSHECLGYNYINLDDGFQRPYRDSETQQLVVNTDRFPSGLTWLAEQAHERGMTT